MKKIESKKILISLLITILVGAILVFLFINDFGIVKYLRLKSELRLVQSQINRSDVVIDSLKNEIDSLQKSRQKIEKVAREKYDLKLKSEKVIKVTEK